MCLYIKSTKTNILKMINNSSNNNNPKRADFFLDITGDVCPLTFVKTKLLLERAAPGAIAEVRFKGAEPLENVPRSVAEDGHEILSLAPEPDQEEPKGAETIYRMWIRRS